MSTKAAEKDRQSSFTQTVSERAERRANEREAREV
jgi:hypothetical protein